ncbi:MAG: hypothetical protein AAF677_06230 [Pseudomonadota bacterium]
MNRLDARLTDVLEPVRDIAVGEILEVMARKLDVGCDVRPEPEHRNAHGHVAREGRLNLPRRGDLLVLNGTERQLLRQVCSPKLLSFEPITLVEADGFVSVITPFYWDRALIQVDAQAEDEPDWRPLRRWYLEWFQARFSDEAPDLEGVVHSLSGPRNSDSGYQFEADLGSAPVETLSDMIGAFAESGARRIRIGIHPQPVF